ncbi:magnesium-transporting ATPase (P-type) [Microbacterium sp. W4I20]|nr:magnesium-transporting ATPase (P-type) [Microbacterium sp. W4I20]
MMGINWLSVVLAIVVGMIVAFVWYQKGPIASAWEKLTGVTPERIKPVRVRSMVQLFITVIIMALGLAVVIQLAAEATGDDSVWAALLVGLVMWVAFSASTLVQHNAFELKPAKLTIINTGYQLVLFLAMSLVLGLL